MKEFLGRFFKIHIARLIKILGPIYLKTTPQMILILLTNALPSHLRLNDVRKNMVDLFRICSYLLMKNLMVADIRPKQLGWETLIMNARSNTGLALNIRKQCNLQIKTSNP